MGITQVYDRKFTISLINLSLEPLITVYTVYLGKLRMFIENLSYRPEMQFMTGNSTL